MLLRLRSRWALAGGVLALVGLASACRDAAAGGSGGVPAWPDTLPAASALGAPRGYAPVRAVIHVHTILSHDACDGEPVDAAGRPNEPCLARFRGAVCTARLGAVFVTDHDRRMVEIDSLPEALLLREGDELLRVDGGVRASRIPCPGGGALVFPGAENQLMPVGLDSLPRGTTGEKRAWYDADTAGVAAAYRDYGAVVLLPHPEDEPLATIAALDPDGIEIYSPHANFSFKHRANQGLSRFGAALALLPFYLRATAAHPDLALLPMFRANQDAIGKWDALLGSGRNVVGFGASDAHENSLPWALADGERGDAYERMMPWVTNVLLVPGADPVAAGDVEAIEEALRRGRFYVAIEAWGTPAGFDFRLEGPDGVAEMGASVPLVAGQRLVVEPPRVAGPAPGAAPAVRARLFRIDGDRRAIVAESDGRIEAPVEHPGAYRVEVGIVPRHLSPYLGGDGYLREVTWIYSNPIRVTAPEGSP